MVLKCPKCGYEWESRVENPKSCPDCKQRFSRIGSAILVYGEERQKIADKTIEKLKEEVTHE